MACSGIALPIIIIIIIIRLYTTILLYVLYLINLRRHVSGYKPIFRSPFPFPYYYMLLNTGEGNDDLKMGS
jgi:hypothetical protein